MEKYNFKTLTSLERSSFHSNYYKIVDVPQHCYVIINNRVNPGFVLKTGYVSLCTAFYAINKEKEIICLAHFDGHTCGAKKMMMDLQSEAGGTLEGFEFGAISGISVPIRFFWSISLSIFAGYLFFCLFSIYFPWLRFAAFFLVSLGLLTGLMVPIIGIIHLTRKKYMKTPVLALKPLGLILGGDVGELFKDDVSESKSTYENKGCFFCPIRRKSLVN